VAGIHYTCALLAGGNVKCWGDVFNGLGDGTGASSPTPVDVVGLASGVTQLAGSGYHVCALLADGSVRCWGANYIGQLGDGTITDMRPTPVAVQGLAEPVVQIAAGGLGVQPGFLTDHSCALLASGRAQCWGSNSHGQLGDGTTAHHSLPGDVIGLEGIRQLAAGYAHTCAVLDDGLAACWGNNEKGQLGDGTQIQRLTPVPVVGLGGSVVALAAGGTYGVGHTCAVLDGGGLQCWGASDYGQVGSIVISAVPNPVTVAGLPRAVVEVAAGGVHTCARLTGGRVWCWGARRPEYSLALGWGNLQYFQPPVEVIDLPAGMLSVAANGTPWSGHECALTAAGGVKCWGANQFGQLGNGTHQVTSGLPAPVDVVGLPGGVQRLAVGGFHSCAVTSAGVYCWGANRYGALGNGQWGTDAYSVVPVAVSGLATGVVTVAAGYDHTCALMVTGVVKCWGVNGEGQLGDGTDVYSRSVPVDVVGLAGPVQELTAAGDHTCARTASSVQCWGANRSGQLGDGTAVFSRSVPVTVTGLAGNIIQIDAGGGQGNMFWPVVGWDGQGHTCALADSGALQCWGRNRQGQLGDGTTTDRLAPVPVAGLPPALAVSAGGYHTCALTTTHAVYCWGYNQWGELGDGTTVDRPVPGPVMGLAGNVTALEAGGRTTCVLAGAGRVKCWGSNELGQVGIGRGDWHPSPVADAELLVSAQTGQPGSVFTVTGLNYPPSSSVTLAVNGQPLAPVTTTAGGAFQVFLETELADAGRYALNSTPAAVETWLLLLKAAAPLRVPEGDGMRLSVPPGIGLDQSVFLPWLR
jgi:alpha-tubulin suppressor-like RCC1 family protein